MLSLSTGLVSPQFHVKYDDTFSTLRNNDMPKSMWQQLAGLETRKVPDRVIIERRNIPIGENNDINQNVAQDEPEQESDQVSVHTEPETDKNLDISDDASDSDSECEESESDVEAHSEPYIATRSGRISRFPSRFQDYI